MCASASPCPSSSIAYCEDGAEICSDQLCDEVTDCQDGSDEYECAYWDKKPGFEFYFISHLGVHSHFCFVTNQEVTPPRHPRPLSVRGAGRGRAPPVPPWPALRRSLTAATGSVSPGRGGATTSETATTWRTREAVPVLGTSSPAKMEAVSPQSMSVTRATTAETSLTRWGAPAQRPSSSVTSNVSLPPGSAMADTTVVTSLMRPAVSAQPLS